MQALSHRPTSVTHDGLLSRLDELRDVKETVDRRRCSLDVALNKVLSSRELAEYNRCLDAVSRNRVDMLWLNDRLDVARCQLSEITRTHKLTL
jgi:hypothetical protein